VAASASSIMGMPRLLIKNTVMDTSETLTHTFKLHKSAILK